MGLLGFFSRKSIAGTVAIFDVKSGSVGGALVVFKPNTDPLIRFAHRASFSPKEGGSPLEHERAMTTALKSVALTLCAQGLPQMLREDKSCAGVDHIAVFMGVPWAQVRVESKTLATNEPLLISEKWMRETLESVLTRSEESASSRLLERSIIKVLINGYPTTVPVGKRAERVSLVALEARIPEHIAASAERVLTEAFHISDVTLRSALLASFTTIRDHFENEDNFLLMNVGNYVTELALVREDSLEAMSVLPRGTQTLLESGVQALGSTVEEVGSLLTMHAQGKLTDNNKKTETALALLESEWQQAFDGVLSSLKASRGLPHTLFLLAPPSLSPWFSALLRSRASAVHTLTKEPFRVVELHGEELLKHHHIHAQVVPDAPLSIQTLFLKRLSGQIS
jgi:hypothetical protein